MPTNLTLSLLVLLGSVGQAQSEAPPNRRFPYPLVDIVNKDPDFEPARASDTLIRAPRKKMELVPTPAHASGPVRKEPEKPPVKLPMPKADEEKDKSVVLPEPNPAVSTVFGDCGVGCGETVSWLRAGFLTVDAEMLLWFFEREEVPAPLISTDPSAFLIGIGTQGQQIFRNPSFDFMERPLVGGRFTVGYWIPDFSDPTRLGPPVFAKAGVELRGTFFGERSIRFRNDTDPELTRPFFNLNTRQEAAFLVGAPGVATGSIDGSASLDAAGAEANGVVNVFSNAPGTSIRVDLLAGYRYQSLDGNLLIRSQTVFAPDLTAFPAIAGLAGNRLDVLDEFDTQNDFHGGQVGARLQFVGTSLIATTSFKAALGGNHQRLKIGGGQVRTFANGSQSVAGAGLLALQSNSGTFSRTRTNFIFELGLNFELIVSKCLSLYGGYALLGWGDVIRPVAQIDRVLDVTQIPNFPTGGAVPTSLGRPGVTFVEESLRVHGVNFGAKLTW